MAQPAMLLIAAVAALCLATTEPGPFLTAPQRETRLDPLQPATVDVSADGRYVAFESTAPLVPADTNNRRDIYVLDLGTTRVTLESAVPDRTIDASRPRLSGNGQFLVYEAIVDGGGLLTPSSQIVLCDRWSSAASVVSIGLAGQPANGWSREADISDDGGSVVFASTATNLVSGADLNGRGEDIYAVDVRNRAALRRVSLDAAGVQPPVGVSFSPSVNGDGTKVAFSSSAPLVAGVGGSRQRRQIKQVYVRDLAAAVTTLVSATAGSAAANADSWRPSIDRSGRFVAFVSEASNLGGGRDRTADVFLRDLRSAAITLVSRTADGEGGSGTSGNPALSGDGRFVAFQSDAPDLSCARRCQAGAEDINLLADVFLFDRENPAATVRVSRNDASEWLEPSYGPSIDHAGRVMAFASRHPIDALDLADDFDLFVTGSAGGRGAAADGRRP